jgi:putative tryptophan/tyrosine transport system substrate-binding protein
MKRRDLVFLLMSAVLAPVPAAAQQSAHVPRVGVLTPADSATTPIFDAFRTGLRELGYIDGQTIILDFRLGKGSHDALPGLAHELVDLPVDIIVTDSSTAAVAAFAVTRTIPIVMGIATGNPVELGLAASLARPGGNVTGMTLGAIELNGKRMQLIKQAIPAVAHVALLLNAKNAAAEAYLASTNNVGAALGERFTIITVTSPADLSGLGPSDLAGADALAVLPDAMFWNHRSTIIALAERASVPAIYPEREYADDGGLIAYGPNVPDAFRRAAGYVDRILRGAKPGDLPIDEAAKFDFVINLRTAHKLGLDLPPDFIARADEVIE